VSGESPSAAVKQIPRTSDCDVANARGGRRSSYMHGGRSLMPWSGKVLTIGRNHAANCSHRGLTHRHVKPQPSERGYLQAADRLRYVHGPSIPSRSPRIRHHALESGRRGQGRRGEPDARSKCTRRALPVLLVPSLRLRSQPRIFVERRPRPDAVIFRTPYRDEGFH